MVLNILWNLRPFCFGTEMISEPYIFDTLTILDQDGLQSPNNPTIQIALHFLHAAVAVIVVRKKQLQETMVVTNVTAIEIS